MDSVPELNHTKNDAKEITHRDLENIEAGNMRVISEEDEIALKEFLTTLKNNDDFHVVPDSKGGKKKKRNLGKTKKRKNKRKRKKTKRKLRR